MPDFSQWGEQQIDAAARAADAWGRIQRDPQSIEFLRKDSPPDAQTVRVEVSNTWIRENTPVNTQTRIDIVVFGIRQHATLTSTDMKVGDRFSYNGNRYEIQTVVEPPGERQGFGERIG